jgi:LysM repeat protein
MARFPWSGLHTGRSQNRIYIIAISTLLTIAAVTAVIFCFRHFGKNKPNPDTGLDTGYSTLDEHREAQTPQNIVSKAEEPQTNSSVTQLASNATSQANLQVAELISEVVTIIKETPDKVIEARDKLNDALLMPMSAQQQILIKSQLTSLSEQWLFSKSLFANDKLCTAYKVTPGEQLRTIGQQHKISYEILMQINNIQRPQDLQAGQIIKVINGPFNAKVYRSTFTMDLYLQNTFVRSFFVGLGKANMETPTGLWRVKDGGKLITPPWTDPDTNRTYHAGEPDYPLGSRWIELEGIEGQAKGRAGFGIHGTKEPETIGTASSRGCIRLHNGEAILIYNLLMPTYSLVRIE